MMKAIREVFAQRFASHDSVRARCPGGLCGKYAPGDPMRHRGASCPCGIDMAYVLEPGTWHFEGLQWNPLTWGAWKWMPAAGTAGVIEELRNG